MPYNSCDKALEICPNTTININNFGANKTFCGGCEDDFNFCYQPTNTIWMKFTTNDIGGNVQIQFSNPAFEINPGQDVRYNASLIQANIPCNAVSYTEVGNCILAANNNQTITATDLLPNTTYYIVISGELEGIGITTAAEFSIDISVVGSAFNRPIPFINLGIATTICAGDLVAILSDRGNCSDPGGFRWYINGILRAVTPTDSIFFTTELQDGDIVSVESSCFAMCPVTISQTLPPVSVVTVVADAGPDMTIGPNEVVQIHGNASPNTVILWTPTYALSDSSIVDPIANPAISTTYTMQVTDTITNCSAVDFVTITVENGLVIPTTFSPNNDGENDKWILLGIEAYPDCLVTIFNRWGQQVFQSNGYNEDKAWDGRGKSGEVHEGVYFYELQLRDQEKQILKGSITLIR